MVAYSFRPRFVDPIVAGLEPGPLVPGMKRQTIRAAGGGKRHVRDGEFVQLYTGMRTRACRLLGTAQCVSVDPIRLCFGPAASVRIGPEEPFSAMAELDSFARDDGFADWSALVAFWEAEHAGPSTFDGLLIRWEPRCPQVRS